MRPDRGKARDKARLQAKKAGKAEAKARRRADAAGHTEADLLALERHLKARTGANRRSAFTALRAVDAERARRAVLALLQGADGRTRAELGALLVSTGDPAAVDDAIAGRLGDVALWREDARVWTAAAERVLAAAPRLSAGELTQRAQALGVLPLQPEVRRHPEVAALLTRLIDSAALQSGAREAAIDALLDVDPRALWTRTDVGGAELTTLAGLASGVAAIDGHDVDALLAHLAAVPPPRRSALLVLARLPESALGLSRAARVPLLAAVVADELALPSRRAAAADQLAREGTPDAVQAVLAHPVVSDAATAQACAGLDPHEAWSVVAPHFATRATLRDALLATPLAASPLVLDAVVQLLPHDPLGAMAFLARNRDPRAREEVAHAFERASPELARLMFIGLTTGTLRGDARVEAAALPFAQALSGASPRLPQPARDRAAAALRSFLPRAGALAPQVRAAVARLG